MKDKILIGLLGILCVGAMGYVYLNQKNVRAKLDEAAKGVEILAMERALLLDNSMLCYKYNGLQLPDLMLYDEEGNTYHLSELLTDKYKLIVRFSYLHCSSCINDLFQNLKTMIDRFPADDVLIIGEYANLRAFLAFKNSFSLPYSIYWIAEGEEEILREENLPYACIMNKERIIHNLMVPMKEIPKHSTSYYNIMYSRYFK